MKKNHFIAMVCMVALCACTKEVKFNPENATLYAGDSIQVTVENAGATPKLVSENTFVASVSETGWLKARHVGETTVRCDYNTNTAENIARCNVTVQPKYTYYTEPIIDWTTTKDQLIEKLGEPSIDQEEMLIFGDVSKDDFVYMYVLSDDYIVQSYIVHKTLTLAKAKEFLNERYAPLEEEDDTTYIDADDEENAKMYVHVEQGNVNPLGNVVLVIYTTATEY